MTVRLRRLREDEYAEFLERGRREYAKDLHENGSRPREAAAAKAARDFAQLLPEGLR